MGISGSRPQLEVDNARWSFGSGEPEAVISHVFKIRNNLRHPIQFDSWRTRCGCTVVTVPKTRIEAGESINIPAKVSLHGQRGHFSTGFVITYHDASAAQKVYGQTFEIEGDVKNVVVVNPDRLYLDPSVSGRAAVSVSSAQRDFRVLRAQSDNAALTVRLHDDFHGFDANFLPSPNVKSGQRIVITFWTNSPTESRITLPVYLKGSSQS